MWQTHAPFNKCHKKEKEKEKNENKKNENKKVTLHIVDTWRTARVWLTSLVICIDDKFCDLKERNVTIRSEI